MLNYDEKWPYKVLSKDDDEQALIKNSLSESLVAFIDVLGFKDMVSHDIDKVILALRYIKLFRDSFYSLPSRMGNPVGEQLDAYCSNDNEDEDELDLPKATMFSDSIVISQAIENVSSFSDFVEFIGQMQFELLSEGILIRGGIEIGGLYHDDTFIFGEGLVSAYLLESNFAKYPRIVLSPKVIERIQKDNSRQFEDEFRHYFIFNGEKHYLPPPNLEDYFIKDELFYLSHDDYYYIDYIKLGLRMLKASDAEYLEMGIQLVDHFYDDTLSRIIRVIQIGLRNQNEGVREKFQWLKTSYNNNIKRYLRTYKGCFKNPDDEKKLLANWTDKFLI